MAEISLLGAEFSGRRRASFLRGMPSFREHGECCTSEWKWGIIGEYD